VRFLLVIFLAAAWMYLGYSIGVKHGRDRGYQTCLGEQDDDLPVARKTGRLKQHPF
jgi:hypothetical protein